MASFALSVSSLFVIFALHLCMAQISVTPSIHGENCFNIVLLSLHRSTWTTKQFDIINELVEGGFELFPTFDHAIEQCYY